jgi:hypothetical protein
MVHWTLVELTSTDMSFELFQQPISDIASILTNSTFVESPYDIDGRLHDFLKQFNSTARLRDLIRELQFRHERNFTPLVFVEQIENLSDATGHLESQIEKETLRRDEIEYAYICIGDVFRSMTYITPKLKFIKNTYTDNRASLVSLKQSFKELIEINNILALRFEMLDDSHRKLETKRLKGLLYKTNYFLEYKHMQVDVTLKNR